MKRIAYAVAATAATLLGSSLASADIIVGSATNTWQPFPTIQNNYSDANRPYWDNLSRDVTDHDAGGNENIGNYLNGPFAPLGITVQSPLITPSWWGHVGTAASNYDLSPHFERGNSGDIITATLLFESSDNASKNAVGWYDVNTGVKTLLWAGSDAAGSVKTFEPTGDWGFYFVGTKGTYFMEAAKSTSDKTHPHFAFFLTDATDGGEHYVVGIEDLPWGTAAPEGTGDFNDFVFSFESTIGGGETNTPEPTSLAILGMGAAGLLVRRRK